MEISKWLHQGVRFKPQNNLLDPTQSYIIKVVKTRLKNTKELA